MSRVKGQSLILYGNIHPSPLRVHIGYGQGHMGHSQGHVTTLSI